MEQSSTGDAPVQVDCTPGYVREYQRGRWSVTDIIQPSDEDRSDIMSTTSTFEYTCTLKEDTLALAKQDLNEDPDTRMLELKAFRDRTVQYPGLFPRTDPEFLIRFLRARKFDQERAFQLLLNYYRMRKDHPKLFTGLKPSDVAHIYRDPVAFPWPHRDRQGRKVYILHVGKCDPSRHNMEDFIKAEFLNMSKMIEDEETQVRGFTVVSDYAGVTMSTFLWMQTNLEISKLSIKMWQDSFPARLKAALIVNESPILDVVMALFTPFLKDKIVKRIHRIGTDWQKLHEFISPDCLPKEYGGTMDESPDPKEWEEYMMSCDKQLEDESKYGFVDYTIGHKVSRKEQDAITNMAGTFRKLNVD